MYIARRNGFAERLEVESCDSLAGETRVVTDPTILAGAVVAVELSWAGVRPDQARTQGREHIREPFLRSSSLLSVPSTCRYIPQSYPSPVVVAIFPLLSLMHAQVS